MIIGLMGQKHSGKDTAAAYLVKEHSFERRAFADPGKKYMASVLDIPLWEIEKLKNDPSVFVTVGNKNEPNPKVTEFIQANIPPEFEDFEFVPPKNMWSPIREQTFRQFMQNFIENAKQIFGEDVWANATLPVDGFYGGRAIVLSDVRFQVEAQRIKDIGGFVVLIERPCPREQDLHRSETEQLNIESDYAIINSGSVENLYSEIELMLTDFSEDWVG